MNKKVLFIDTSKIWGGAEIYLYEYISKLISLGDTDIFVASFFDGQYKKILDTNFIHIDVGSLRKESAVRNLISLLKSAFLLNKSICKFGISSLVANNPRSYLLSVLLKIINPRLKIHFIVHELVISKYMFKLLSIFSYRNIYVSDIVQNKYSNIFQDKSVIIKNAFDFGKIRHLAMEKVPSELVSKIGNKKVVGMAGYFYKWKGQLEFLQVAKVVLQKNPNILFLLIGGPKIEDQDSLGYCDEIKNFIKMNNLESNVYITGSVENPYKYMNVCDLLVHASLYPEPFGRVIVEYMILDKPVLVSKYAKSFDCQKIDPVDIESFAHEVEKKVDQESQIGNKYDLGDYDIDLNVKKLVDVLV